MAPKIKNTITFTAIATIFILIYVFFVKASPSTATLVSSSNPTASNIVTLNKNPSIADDFLTLLLTVKNIKLDDAIFSDNAFNSLRDSSIILTPDGSEGRPNPFAPIGVDIIVPPANIGVPITP